MDMDTFQDEYDILYENIQSTKKKLEDLHKEYRDLTAHIRTNIIKGALFCSTIQQFSLDRIKDGIVRYTYVSSFGGEWDDPRSCRIPLKFCDSIQSVRQYYERRVKRIEEIRDILENRQRRDEAIQIEKEIESIESKERALYEKLKQKFEPTPKEI